MASVTITPAKASIANLRNILSRIDQQYGLIWTETRNAVHGNVITASIDFEENQYGHKPVSVTISSNYYSTETLTQAADKAKGKGYISHENGELVSYMVEVDHSQRPETQYFNSYQQAEAFDQQFADLTTSTRAYKVVGEQVYNMYTDERVEADQD